MATTAELQTERAKLVTARDKILDGGQAYTAEGRQMTRADLGAINARLDKVDVLLARATRGSAIGYGVPIP